MERTNVEVFEMFKGFYGNKVSDNKKEVLNDLLVFLNRYEATTKYVVESIKWTQSKNIISVDTRVSLADDEDEFRDFYMVTSI